MWGLLVLLIINVEVGGGKKIISFDSGGKGCGCFCIMRVNGFMVGFAGLDENICGDDVLEEI